MKNLEQFSQMQSPQLKQAVGEVKNMLEFKNLNLSRVEYHDRRASIPIELTDEEFSIFTAYIMRNNSKFEGVNIEYDKNIPAIQIELKNLH